MFVVFAAGARTVKMFRSIMISLEKSVSTWQSVPVNKVIIKVRTMLRSALLVIGYVESWRYRISWEKNTCSYSRRSLPFSLRKHPFLLALRRWGCFAKSEEKRMFSQATFPFPLHAFLPPPSPSFLRLPRRLKLPNDSMRSAVRYRYYYLPIIVISWLLLMFYTPKPEITKKSCPIR